MQYAQPAIDKIANKRCNGATIGTRKRCANAFTWRKLSFRLSASSSEIIDCVPTLSRSFWLSRCSVISARSGWEMHALFVGTDALGQQTDPAPTRMACVIGPRISERLGKNDQRSMGRLVGDRRYDAKRVMQNQPGRDNFSHCHLPVSFVIFGEDQYRLDP